MNRKFVVLMFWFLFSGFLCRGDEKNFREEKFSIFSVIRFPNSVCVAQSDITMSGVCLTSDECDEQSGTKDGNCASGFGVCCVIFVKTCGSVSVTHNSSYIVNKDYPSTSSTQGSTCVYNVKADSFNNVICQLRLDFDEFKLVQPTTSTTLTPTNCEFDSIKISGPSGRSPPETCGTLTGSHMYVETARKNAAATVTIKTGSTAFNREWKIKVMYIECFSPSRAPTDCQQYFTGVAGNVISYNWDGLTQVYSVPQEYTSCFRQEVGYCALDYSIGSDGSSPDYFQVNRGTSVKRSVGNSGCKNYKLEIILQQYWELSVKGTTQDTLEFCGGQFGIYQGETVPSVVRTDVTPFMLRTFFVGNSAPSGSLEDQGAGFNIQWKQVPCGGK